MSSLTTVTERGVNKINPSLRKPSLGGVKGMAVGATGCRRSAPRAGLSGPGRPPRERWTVLGGISSHTFVNRLNPGCGAQDIIVNTTAWAEGARVASEPLAGAHREAHTGAGILTSRGARSAPR